MMAKKREEAEDGDQRVTQTRKDLSDRPVIDRSDGSDGISGDHLAGRQKVPHRQGGMLAQCKGSRTGDHRLCHLDQGSEADPVFHPEPDMQHCQYGPVICGISRLNSGHRNNRRKV